MRAERAGAQLAADGAQGSLGVFGLASPFLVGAGVRAEFTLQRGHAVVILALVADGLVDQVGVQLVAQAFALGVVVLGQVGAVAVEAQQVAGRVGGDVAPEAFQRGRAVLAVTGGAHAFAAVALRGGGIRCGPALRQMREADAAREGRTHGPATLPMRLAYRLPRQA